MADPFNPYHVWLGIPPEEQPASHYRLLGLKDFESNHDAISSASDQRLAFLRTLQHGKHRALSQALLNEISAATACLLNDARRAKYDQELRQKHAQRAERVEPKEKRPVAKAIPAAPVAIPVARPIPPTEARVIDVPVAPPRASVTEILPEAPPQPVIATWLQWLQQPAARWPLIAGASFAGACVALAILIFVQSRRAPQPVARLPVETASAASPAQKPPGSSNAVPQSGEPTSTKESKPATTQRPTRTFKLPDEDETNAATKWFADKYRTQQVIRIQPQLSELAEQLTQDAETTTSGPLVHALLTRAREAWARAGEVEAALAATDRLTNTFALSKAESLDLRMLTYRELSGGYAWTPTREALADRLFAEIEAALEASEIGLAEEYSHLTFSVTHGMRKTERKQRAADLRSKIGEANMRTYEQAKVVLAKEPTSPAANLIVGKFLCRTLDKWETGLPHLAAGQPSLATAVAADLAATNVQPSLTSPDVHMATADAYCDWELNFKDADRELRQLIRKRGAHWYHRAAQGLRRPAFRPATQRLYASPAYSQIPSPSLAWGLFGSIHVNTAQLPGLLRYRPGDTITAQEFADLFKDYRRPTDEVRIVLEGKLHVETAGEFHISVKGDTAGDVKHAVHFDGKQLLSVGDSAFQTDSRQLQLAPGEFPLKWELSGRNFGSARLEVKQVNASDAPQIGITSLEFSNIWRDKNWHQTLGQGAIPFRAQPSQPSAAEKKLIAAPVVQPPPARVPIISPAPPSVPARRFKLPSDAESAEAMKWLANEKKYQSQLGREPTREQYIACAEQVSKDLATEDSGPRVFRMLLYISHVRSFAGDTQGALHAIDQAAQMFPLPEVDEVGYRMQCCRVLAQAPMSPAQREALALQLHEEVESALRAVELSQAKDALGLAESMSSQHRQRATEQRERIEQLRPACEQFYQWKAQLKKNPGDRLAHLRSAKFLCNVLNNYQQGLPHLAAISDLGLAKIVASDRTAADAPPGKEGIALQLAAADAWYDWWKKYEKTDTHVELIARSRATHWYKAVLPALSGEARKIPEARAKEIDPMTGVQN